VRSDAALLTRYWITFDTSTRDLQLAATRVGVGLGCGVTAYSYDDALFLLESRIFRDEPILPILNVIENVDIRTLDAGHVRPNMGVPTWRGIWFPVGHEIHPRAASGDHQ
jgi:hypothetical protein